MLQARNTALHAFVSPVDPAVSVSYWRRVHTRLLPRPPHSLLVLYPSQELNRSLEANKPQLLANLEQAQRDLDAARKAREEWVPKLEEKVAALMLKLDAGAVAAAAVGGKPARAGSTTTKGSAASIGANRSSGGGSGGGGAGDGTNDQQRSGGLASPWLMTMDTPPAVAGRGAKAKAPAEQEGERGGLGGAEETKGAGAGAGAGTAGGGCVGMLPAIGAVGSSVDDDRGGDRRGSSPLSAPAGGGSNTSSSGSSGKKKGRRRKSK